jgi:hypothetical protein
LRSIFSGSAFSSSNWVSVGLALISSDMVTKPGQVRLTTRSYGGEASREVEVGLGKTAREAKLERPAALRFATLGREGNKGGKRKKRQDWQWRGARGNIWDGGQHKARSGRLAHTHMAWHRPPSSLLAPLFLASGLVWSHLAPLTAAGQTGRDPRISLQTRGHAIGQGCLPRPSHNDAGASVWDSSPPSLAWVPLARWSNRREPQTGC